MRDGRITEEFADGDYSFRLGWGELIELQEKTDAGPYVVFRRLMEQTWRIEDVAEVIRLGLIGGGMDHGKALTMVKRYVRQRPLLDNVPLATAILGTALAGGPDEKVGTSGSKSRDKEADPKGKMEFAHVYGKGAVMGYSPQQINEMTIWQFVAAWEGYVKHHSGDEAKMTDKESDELFNWLKSQEFDVKEIA